MDVLYIVTYEWQGKIIFVNRAIYIHAHISLSLSLSDEYISPPQVETKHIVNRNRPPPPHAELARSLDDLTPKPSPKTNNLTLQNLLNQHYHLSLAIYRGGATVDAQKSK